MSDPQPATPASADWEAFYANYRKPGYVPGYELTTKLGGGQFGIVYRARKQSIGKDYAIKFLQVDDGEVRRAIVAELEQLRYFAQIDHPNLVSIEDRGEVDGIPYLVMSFAGTQTLRDRIVGDGRPPRPEERDALLQLFLQACRGVAALHDRSLVHFDLKPANVFLKGNVARVGDYGLSKLVTHSRGSLSMGRGTPYYMAPELLQRRGDARSDVYSLGVMLFEILCGKVPFTGDSEWEVLKKHEQEELRVPDHVGHRERGVLVRCLAKDPAQRFQSVVELLAAFGAPTGAGAAAWSEVKHGAPSPVADGPELQPLPSWAPQPPPPPPDAYTGLRQASREAWGHARTIARDATKKARELADKARHDARGAWQEVKANPPKAARRVFAWKRLQGIRRARRRRERAERRRGTGRTIAAAFSFLFLTLGLAVGGFLLFAVAAPRPMPEQASSATVDVRAEVDRIFAAASASPMAPPDPAAPLFSVVAVPGELEGAVSRDVPAWLALSQQDLAAAQMALRADVARIGALAQDAARLGQAQVPTIEARLRLPVEQQADMMRLLDELLTGANWQQEIATALQQHAPESLALAATKLAATRSGTQPLRQAERLRQFLEQATGFHGLPFVEQPGMSSTRKARANAALGRLWLWYLNETAWSKDAWSRSTTIR